MFGHDKNITDTTKNPLKDTNITHVPYGQEQSMSNHYPKLNKLITALYIVTDIIEKSEPIRLKLRTLGTDILSDINSRSRSELKDKAHTVLSLLDIAVTIHLISEMNCNILKKEFRIFYESLGETEQKVESVSHTWLEEFLKEPPLLADQNASSPHMLSTPKTNKNSDTDFSPHSTSENQFLELKKKRRADIIEAIKMSGGNATITEVKQHAGATLAAYGEKTLQRELISMVKDNILNKTGEKRWSRYSIKNENDTVGNKSTS